MVLPSTHGMSSRTCRLINVQRSSGPLSTARNAGTASNSARSSSRSSVLSRSVCMCDRTCHVTLPWSPENQTVTRPGSLEVLRPPGIVVGIVSVGGAEYFEERADLRREVAAVRVTGEHTAVEERPIGQHRYHAPGGVRVRG